MDNKFFSDSWVEAFSKVVIASLPFITMGFIGHPDLTIAAGCTGGVALFAFLIRVAVLFKKSPKRIPVLDSIMNGLFFPYVCALSFGIGIAYGEKSGWYGVWFSLLLAAFIIIANCVSYKKN